MEMKYTEVTYKDRRMTDYPSHFAEHIAYNYMFPFGKHKTLLDVGCGDAVFLKEFNKYFEIYGVDKETLSLYGTKIKRINIETDRLPFENNAFDLVFSKSTIEHIKNTDWMLSEIHRVLKPMGKIIILTPAWEYNYRQFYDDYTHVKPFCRKGLQSALEINNFGNIKVDYFYHLKYTWRYPFLKCIPKLIAVCVPNKYKWRDNEETIQRTWVRFSKEVNLIGVGEK